MTLGLDQVFTQSGRKNFKLDSDHKEQLALDDVISSKAKQQMREILGCKEGMWPVPDQALGREST